MSHAQSYHTSGDLRDGFVVYVHYCCIAVGGFKSTVEQQTVCVDTHPTGVSVVLYYSITAVAGNHNCCSYAGGAES